MALTNAEKQERYRNKKKDVFQTYIKQLSRMERKIDALKKALKENK